MCVVIILPLLEQNCLIVDFINMQYIGAAFYSFETGQIWDKCLM